MMAGRKKIYGDELNPEIARLYTEENLSLYAISQKMGVHPEVVKRKLTAMNIPVRNKSNAMKLFYRKKREES
jgi:hypothetical protein